MCERFEDASVIQTVASSVYKDTLRPPLERHSRAEKNPTMTKIVLLWLLSKTIVNVSYYIVGHVPRRNHFSTACSSRFVFEERRHNFECCKRSGKATPGDQQHEQQLIC